MARERLVLATRIRPRVGSAALLLALAACGEAYEPDELRANQDEIATVDVPAWPDDEANAVAGGQWRSGSAAQGASLSFTPDAASRPVFRIACDGRGGMLLERLGVEAIAGIRMMEIKSGGQVTRLALNQPETETAILRAAIPYNHDLMAVLARPGGQVSIRAAEGPILTLPLTAETAALAETCREPESESA
jgi:hypothetical protein